MTITLAFDVYGTMIDTNGVVLALRHMVGDRASAFAEKWRDKQLEYSFRKGLMQNYEPFSICTLQALEFANAYFDSELSDAQKTELIDVYQTLPAFADVKPGLAVLKKTGIRLYAFSNGTVEAQNRLLEHAGIRDYSLDLVSADDLKTFKPNPGVYAHFLRQAETSGTEAWLVSSNPFDVIGAISAGMKSAWVKRSESALFDPWGILPTAEVQNIEQLVSVISKA